jgi:hypothetical protein
MYFGDNEKNDQKLADGDWLRQRFAGIERPYSRQQVEKLRGSVKIAHTLSDLGSRRLWDLLQKEDYVNALGALTGNQAMQQVRAGLKAIYLSGWQVAADANLAGRCTPTRACIRPTACRAGEAYQPGAAARRPDRERRGQGVQALLARADHGRRRGRLRRPAQRVRADEGHDRGRRLGRPLRGPARQREEVRPHGRQGARARRASSSARWSRLASRPTCCGVPASSWPARTRTAPSC